MPKSNDQQRRSAGTKLDRRTVIRGAFAVGGASVLGRGAANAQAEAVAEREWARTLARTISNQLPEAARQIPDLCLTADQLEQLRRVFENTLVTNMGCDIPPS
jgi:hypothetical protein